MEKINKEHGESSYRGSSRGGRSFNRGRGKSSGPRKYFRCNQIGHYQKSSLKNQTTTIKENKGPSWCKKKET